MKNTLRKKIEKFLEDNNIHSYKSDDQWILPYSDNNDTKILIYLKLGADENIGVKFGFRAKIFEDNSEFEENLKTTLLDLNSRLKMGSLALKKDSKIVEYSLDYPIANEDEMELKQYNRCIAFCMAVYNDLVEKKLIRESVIDG